MSRLKQLIHEIHHRSLWQVLLIYVGAGWVVFEIVQTVTEGLGLPMWFPAFAALLLLVGLPVVLATAFVREGEPTAAVSDPTLIPTDEAGTEEGQRRRFLTRRNAAASFVVALAVWGVVAAGWLLFGGRDASAPAVAGERPSVAALPFLNRSGLEEDLYFTDGIHDEILTLLSKISGLSVRGRTSVMQYRDTEKNLRQIGDELNARYILEGGVQRAGGTVRVNFQLVDAESDEHVWAETYDRPLTLENLLGVQSEVALRVAEAVKAVLTAEETERIEQRPTNNLEAYEYYLRGLNYMHKVRDEENLRAAVQMFGQAVELDSLFALALAYLSWAHADYYWWYYDRTEERLAMAREAAESALRIDPKLPAGHLAMGRYYASSWQYDRAKDSFQAALDRDPNSSEIHARLADLARRADDWDSSEALLRVALELDPRDPNNYYNIGATLFFTRQYEEAQRYYDQGLSLAVDQTLTRIFKARLLVAWKGDVAGASKVIHESPREITPGELLGGNINGSRWLFRILLRSSPATYIPLPDSFGADTALYFLAKAEFNRLHGGAGDAHANYDSARTSLESAIVSTPSQPHLHSRLGLVYAGLGRRQEAIREGKIAASLVPLSKDAMDGTDWVAYLGETYVMVGQHEDALDQIEVLLSRPSWLTVHWLKLDPLWDPLRDHPRFQALLAKYE